MTVPPPSRPRRLALVLALGLTASTVVLAAPVEAQTPGREPVLAELPLGARALGLGFAPQLGVDGPGVQRVHPDVLAVHPALVSRAGGMMASHTRFGDGGRAFSASAAREWFGGGVGIVVRTLEYDGRPAGARPGGLDPLVEGPGVSNGVGVSESSAGVTWGRRLFGVHMGVTGRLTAQRFSDANLTYGTVDVGVAAPLGPFWLALSGRNLGRSPELNGNGLDLPTEIVLGAGAYGQPVGPLDLGLAAQVARRDDGELTAGGGVEFGYWPIRGRTFVGRVGFRTVPEGEASPVTLGGSFWGDALIVEYAYQPVDGADGIHRVSLGWR